MIKGSSVFDSHPEIAEQADGWDPSEYLTFSNKKVNWICKSGHKWNASISNRTRLNRGCPYCNNQRVMSGENDLASVYPHLALEAHGWDPKLVIAGTGKKLEWICQKSHVWSSTVANRLRGDHCGVCRGTVVLEGFNDLASQNPEIAIQALGWDASKVYFNSSKKLPWKCSIGHVWSTTVGHRVDRGQGCPYCSNVKMLTGFNDLLTKFPLIASEAVGWDPSKVSPGSTKKYLWQCLKGHQWKAMPVSRTSSKYGCPYCSNTKILSGFNDLQTTHPYLAEEAYGWDTSTVFAGSDSIRKWKCPNLHVYKARVANRAHGRGCPSCAQGGFDPNKDGWLYFLSHPDWEMLQIGITNFPDDRLSTHKKLGWSVLELRGPMNGDLARQWETDILRMLRKNNAVLGSSDIAGKFTGYTESWMKSSFPASSLKELMEKVRLTEDPS